VKNLDLWASKVKSYLRAKILGHAVTNRSNPTAIPHNTTIAQIRTHNEEETKENRTLAIIHMRQYMMMFPSRS